MKRGVAIAAGSLLAACSLAVDMSGLTGGLEEPASLDPDASSARADAEPGTDGAPRPDAEPPACTIPVDSDPKNCGACGRDCLGGTCTKGTCGVSYIATGFDGSLGVGVAAGKVYVGHQAGLTELDLDGKNPRLVVPGNVEYVHATATDVFFTTGGALRRWPRSGGDVATLASAGNMLGVALSPTHAYFARYTDVASGGGVYRVPYPQGGSPQLLFEYDHPEEIDWLDGKLFVGSDGASDAVIAVSDDGTGTRTTLLQGGGPVGVGVRSGHAFIARQGSGEIVRVPIGGGQPTLLAKDLGRPSGIVATEAAIYWAEVETGKVGVLVTAP